MRAESSGGDDESSQSTRSAQMANSAPSTPSVSSVLNRIAKPAQDETSAPWDDKPAVTANVSEDKPKTPDDIIAAIRRRQQQQK